MWPEQITDLSLKILYVQCFGRILNEKAFLYHHLNCYFLKIHNIIHYYYIIFLLLRLVKKVGLDTKSAFNLKHIIVIDCLLALCTAIGSFFVLVFASAVAAPLRPIFP